MLLVLQWEKMLLIMTLTVLLFKASTSQITGYGDSTAEYGRDVKYRCTVANPAGVLQVTWQRVFKDQSQDTLATYSKRFGQQVNEPYQSKVIFTEASLTSTSITLTNLTWEDDSCYICFFNAYPEGSKMKQTCLTVQGISEVKTGVQAPSSAHEEAEVVFSCSATGKPAPTIQWTFPSGVSPSNQPETTTETNSDHTFTSSRNITLRVPPGWSGDVDCLLNTGMMGQRQEKIPFSLRTGKPETNGGKGSSSLQVALVICALIIISCIAVAAVLKRKRLKINRRNENV